MEVNSNGNIIDGIHHCYAFGKVNNETIFYDDDFPCPTFSNSFNNISYSDDLPYLGGSFFGGGSIDGTVRIRRFEWLEDVEPTMTTTTTTTTTTIGETLIFL